MHLVPGMYGSAETNKHAETENNKHCNNMLASKNGNTNTRKYVEKIISTYSTKPKITLIVWVLV